MEDSGTKITFYADARTKEMLDQLDSGTKSSTINRLLREASERGVNLEERIAILESKADHDSHALGAIRHFLMNKFGDQAANELEMEFNNVLFGNRRPTR